MEEKKEFQGFGELTKIDLTKEISYEDISIYAACTGGGYPGNTTSCIS